MKGKQFKIGTLKPMNAKQGKTFSDDRDVIQIKISLKFISSDLEKTSSSSDSALVLEEYLS